MALRIEYEPRAGKDLHWLPGVDKLRVYRKILAYAADPASTAHDVVPLRGTPDGYRLRVGDWRVIFRLTPDTMYVRRVVHRREAYR
jgi:mRNA-degrading endonuclease RelE of RelBE toxin-antitoxin system